MADNRSIFEQMSGTLGSNYAQTLGILSRNNKKKDKKAKDKALIGSILFSGLSEGSKYLKNNILNQITELKEKSIWDSNYAKELWQQGSEIRAEEAAFSKNPSHFYSIAAKNIETSPYGADIARAGGVNNLSPTAYKAYQSLVKAREAEYIANHTERMTNPTASYATFKEFSQGDRDMLTLQANKLRDDPDSKGLFYSLMKRLGVGKDKEIEFNAELKTMEKDQAERYAAAEAYVSPLDVTKFINYDVNGKAIFTLGATVDRTKSDQAKTALREELTNSDKNALWEGYTFNNQTGAYSMNSLPLDQVVLKENNVTRHAGSPFKIKYLKGMKLQKRTGNTDKNGMLEFTGDDDPLGAIPYLVDDIYTKERIIEAQEKAQELNDPTYTRMSKERRYGLAVQQLLNDGNIRFSDNWGVGGWNNYVYIPLNRNLSPSDLQNSNNPNSNINKADLAATIAKQTEIENASDLAMAYDTYLNNKIDAADISGNIEELETLEAIKILGSKADEENRLMFMINPPAELAGTMFSYKDSEGNKQGIVIGSQNQENYKVLYNQFKSAFSPSDTIEKLLNLKGSEDSINEDIIKVPEPVISEDLNPKTPGDIYYNNESDKSPASLLTQSLFNRPVRTITNIDEVLNKIDTVDSVKDLKVSDSKIIRAVRDAYKEDTGDKGILNINDLSLEDYKKYLTMYRSEFIAENQDLFKESQPKSLLAGN
jgi:hypothetical protein